LIGVRKFSAPNIKNETVIPGFWLNPEILFAFSAFGVPLFYKTAYICPVFLEKSYTSKVNKKLCKEKDW